jgi:drug/metabolite transporter (DMT)-like permease
MVLVLSLGAVSLLNVLIRSRSAVNVARLSQLVPQCTALIAWALFGETITGLSLPGMALTVFGVCLAPKDVPNWPLAPVEYAQEAIESIAN